MNQLRFCHVIRPSALVFTKRGTSSEQLDVFAASCCRLIHLSGCHPATDMERAKSADHEASDVIPWTCCGDIPLWPPRQRLLSRAAWTCFAVAPGLMKHPNYRASFSQVLLSVSHFMFMAVSPPAIAIKFPRRRVYRSRSWGASSRDKMFIMSLNQR